MAGFALPNATQYKALALLALLAGHEAVRVAEAVRIDTMAKTRAGMKASPVWKKSGCKNKPMCTEDQKCKMSWRGGCKGEVKGMCKRQFLWGDATPPESCRISPEYMLKDSTKYVPEQYKLILAKVEKIKSECASNVNFTSAFKHHMRLNVFGAVNDALKCKRRYAQVNRAMSYIKDAREEYLAALTPAEKEEDTQKFDEVVASVSSLVGEEAADDLKLLKDTLSDPESKLKKKLVADPRNGMASLTALLAMIIEGDEDQKEEARSIIEGKTELPVDTSPVNKTDDEALRDLPSVELQQLVHEGAKEIGIEPSDGDEDTHTGTTASLMEMQADKGWKGVGDVGRKAMFIATVVLYAFFVGWAHIGLMISLSILTLIICGVGAALKWLAHGEADPIQCIKNAIFVPWLYGGKAAVWTWRTLWMGKKNAGLDWKANAPIK